MILPGHTFQKPSAQKRVLSSMSVFKNRAIQKTGRMVKKQGSVNSLNRRMKPCGRDSGSLLLLLWNKSFARKWLKSSMILGHFGQALQRMLLIMTCSAGTEKFKIRDHTDHSMNTFCFASTASTKIEAKRWTRDNLTFTQMVRRGLNWLCSRQPAQAFRRFSLAY